MNTNPRFLAVHDVLLLHAIAIEDQGGDPTLRDRGLLESAVAMPAQQISGEYLHPDIPSMAAAYAFHICRNHPFVDGNKRAALAAMLAFLSDNGWRFDATVDDAEPVILKLAAGQVDKQLFIEWASKHMREKPKMELRDFFARLDWSRVIQMAESVQASGSEAEASATINEASNIIPMIRHCSEATASAKQRSDESAYAYFNAMGVLLVAIHRVAEDMGYEW